MVLEMILDWIFWSGYIYKFRKKSARFCIIVIRHVVILSLDADHQSDQGEEEEGREKSVGEHCECIAKDFSMMIEVTVVKCVWLCRRDIAIFIVRNFVLRWQFADWCLRFSYGNPTSFLRKRYNIYFVTATYLMTYLTFMILTCRNKCRKFEFQRFF